jgi:hypothetical protein
MPRKRQRLSRRIEEVEEEVQATIIGERPEEGTQSIEILYNEANNEAGEPAPNLLVYVFKSDIFVYACRY